MISNISVSVLNMEENGSVILMDASNTFKTTLFSIVVHCTTMSQMLNVFGDLLDRKQYIQNKLVFHCVALYN